MAPSRTRKQFAVIGLVAVVGLAVLRMGGDRQPAGVEPREAIRVFACRSCGAVEIATPEAIRQRYVDDRVRSGSDDTFFSCSSCEKIAANVLDIDLGRELLACPNCGWEGPTSIPGIQKMVQREEAKGSKEGVVEFRCPTCKDFSARLTPIVQMEEE